MIPWEYLIVAFCIGVFAGVAFVCWVLKRYGFYTYLNDRHAATTISASDRGGNFCHKRD